MAHVQKSAAKECSDRDHRLGDAQMALAERDLESSQGVRAFRGRIARRLLEELETSIEFYFDYIGGS